MTSRCSVLCCMWLGHQLKFTGAFNTWDRATHTDTCSGNARLHRDVLLSYGSAQRRRQLCDHSLHTVRTK